MLGIGNVVTAGSKVASVVRKDLQAWYKADKTQAPLGEEKITNGNFNIGPNLLPSISNLSSWGSVGAVQVSDGIKIFGGGDGTFNYILFAEFNWNNYVHGKTYLVRATVTGGAGSTGKKFRIQDNTSNAGGLVSDDTKTTMTEGVTQSVEFYFTTNNSSNTLALARHTSTGSDYEFTVNSLTLNETNPTDSWVVVQDTADDDIVEFQDGRAKIVYTTSGATGAVGIKESSILTPGRKYRARFTVTEVTPGSGHKVKVHATNETITQLGAGVQEFDFTPSGTGTNFTIHRNSASENCEVFISDVSVREIMNSIQDFSPNSNNALLQSGVCLDFDGTSNYVRLLNYPSVPSSTVTVAFWIKPNISNDNAVVISNGVSEEAGYYIWQDLNEIKVALNNSNNSTKKATYTGSNFYTNNVWQRVVVVIPPNGNMLYYKDGKLVEMESFNYNWAPPRSTEKFVIGGYDSHSASFAYEGQLADVQVYDKLWTASDVEFDYANPDKDVFDDKNRAQVLSENLLASNNSTFDAANDWQVYSTGSINTLGSGVLQVTMSGGGNLVESGARLNTSTIAGVEVGKTYEVKADVWLGTSTTTNGWRIFMGGNQKAITLSTTQTTHTAIITPKSTAHLTIYNFDVGNDNGTFFIDNVSVKEITTQASEILPTNCTTLFRLNEGHGDRVYNAAPMLQANIVNNHDFSGATSVQGNDTIPNDGVGSYSDQFTAGKWVKDSAAGDGVEIDVGTFKGKDNVVKIKIENHANSARLKQRNTIKPNTLYFVETEVFIESGNFRLDTTDNDIANNFITSSTTGSWHTLTKVVESESTAGQVDIFLRSENADNTEFYVNSVSFREIVLPNSAAQAAYANANWITAQPYIPQYAMSSFSKKLVFDGDTDNVDCGTDTSIDNVFTDGGTWSCWISPNNFGEASNPDIIVKGNVRVRVASDSGNPVIRFLKSFSGNNGNWKTPAITFSKLTHVAVAYNSNSKDHNPDIYVDGIKQDITKFIPEGETEAPTGSATSDASSNLYIGGASGGNNNYEGFVDEVSIFNKKLTEAEVQEIFNAGTALDVRDHSCYHSNELVSNNDFTDNTLNTSGTSTNAWTKFKSGTSNASISNGVATLSIDGNNSNVVIHQADIFESGKKYKVSLVAKASANFSITFRESQGALANNTPPTAQIATVPLTTEYQTFEYTFTATGDQGDIFIGRNAGDAAGANQTVTIDNISVKQIQTVAYWRNEGTDTWTDLSAYTNDGTVETGADPILLKLQEVPLFNKDTFGLPMNRVRQRSLNFDGQSYVEIADDNSLDLGTGSFTIEAWAKAKYVDKGSTVNVIFSLGGSVSNPSHNTTGLVMFSTGKFGAYVDGQNFDADDAAVEGLWYHVVVRRNSSGVCNLYINGEQQTDHAPTISNSITNALNPRIGADSNLQRCYHSLIDDVKVYNRVLSTSQIKRNYNATKGLHRDNIISNWSDDFDDSFI